MSIVVSVKNFGPIAEGTVKLAPFTVFIGPNNTGKSFLSTFTYASEINTRTRSQSVLARIRGHSRSIKLDPKIVSSLREELRQQLALPNPQITHLFSKMSKTGRSNLRHVVYADLIAYADSVQSELERCLSGKLADLARVTRPSGSAMELTVREADLNWAVRISYDSEKRESRVLRMPKQPELLARADEATTRIIVRAIGTTVDSVSEISPSFINQVAEDLATFVMSNLSGELHEYLFQALPSDRHYLPAARSGIMQSHKALAAFLVRSAPLVGLQQMQVPQLSGVVADFIGELLNLDYQSHEFNAALQQIAVDLEQEILQGVIEMRVEPDTYPELLYRAGPLEAPLVAPLVRLSSMITEIAPVVLYIRYVLASGHHLIIEEPEAHLHPESQRKFARALAALYNCGINITLTTHSDYLLTEINNLIREHTLATAAGDSAPRYSISADSVAAYLFEPRPSGKGTTITELKVTKDDGIPDQEFGRVAEAIYNLAAGLQYRLIEATGDDEDKD